MARHAKRGKKPRTLVIKDARTVRALRTPVRQEILGAFERLGAGSVKDVAAELGRAPASLYYHIHELEEVGLIEELGRRDAGRRTEAVYGPTAERIVLDRGETSKAFVEAVADLNRAALRTAERELAAALAPARTRKVPPAESVSLLRLTSRLKPADAARARKMLQDVAEFMAERDDAGVTEAFSLTAALVRLARPGRRAR
ncbi:MAG: helix-turn-helix domain-containing protein [Candidatus Eisenbacteria bacterium]